MQDNDNIERLVDENDNLISNKKNNLNSNNNAFSNLKNSAIQKGTKKAGGAIGGAIGGVAGKKVGEKLGEKLAQAKTGNGMNTNPLNKGKSLLGDSSKIVNPAAGVASKAASSIFSKQQSKSSLSVNNEFNQNSTGDSDGKSKSNDSGGDNTNPSSKEKNTSSFLDNKLKKFSGSSKIFGNAFTRHIVITCAPIIGVFLLLLLFFVIFSSIGNTYSVALGAENGDYTSTEFKIFNDNLNEIKNEYSKDGKQVNISMVAAVFSIISMEGGNLDFNSLSKDDIKKVVDASFKNNKYDEETFKENLKGIFKSYFPSYSEGQIKSLINNVLDFSSGYDEIVKDTKKKSTKTPTGSESYWWPIGSSDTTDEDGKTFASGDPETVNITSTFGPRDLTSSGYHYGLDIANGSAGGVVNIVASKSGEVIYPTDNDIINYGDGSLNSIDGGGLGNYVLIKHSDGNYTVYGHMYANSISVRAGEIVKQGQVLGKMGTSGSSTGVHLHFGVYIGQFGNEFAVDPLTYISADNPRPTISGAEFSLTSTILSKDEFIAKMTDYGSRANSDNFNNNFLNKASEIYDAGVKYGVNPELVVVTAKAESAFSNCGTGNYWGIGIPNGQGCSAGPTFSTMEDGVKAYAETLSNYQEGGSMASSITERNNERESAGCSAGGHGLPGTFSGMQSLYSWVGTYRYDPGNWGVGGCIYLELDAIYGAGYCSTKPTCTDYSNCSDDSLTDVCEQNDYTAWQVSKKVEIRQDIFGL